MELVGEGPWDVVRGALALHIRAFIQRELGAVMGV